MNVAFIIGSPRSGTTILGNILNCHPKIAEWYEPYYLWGSYFHEKENDIWPDSYLTEKCKKRIRQEHACFTRKTRKPIVLDKSHKYVFNLNIVQEIFPNAKWIYILRDGRDVTLSINKEWNRRREIVNKKDFLKLFQVALNMLKRQPFWRYRLMAIRYEIRSNASFNPLRYLNKSKWKGKMGWGLRFENWQEYLLLHSTLQFNAMQWIKSVEAVQENWSLLPKKNKIEIRYEDLLKSPKEILAKILETLEVDMPAGFVEEIPTLKKDNFHKWKKEFNTEQLKEISPIITEKLLELRYENDPNWANTIPEQEKR